MKLYRYLYKSASGGHQPGVYLFDDGYKYIGALGGELMPEENDWVVFEILPKGSIVVHTVIPNKVSSFIDMSNIQIDRRRYARND